MDYEKDLQIDQDSLDQEWVYQPQLFFRYAREQVEAKARADAAKERVDVVKAELDGEVRAALQAAGGKMTEAMVSAEIIQHHKYRTAMTEYMETAEEAGLLTAAVRAMDQRKSALENLVRLHGQEYFSAPREDPIPDGEQDRKETIKARKDRGVDMAGAARKRKTRTV